MQAAAAASDGSVPDTVAAPTPMKAPTSMKATAQTPMKAVKAGPKADESEEAPKAKIPMKGMKKMKAGPKAGKSKKAPKAKISMKAKTGKVVKRAMKAKTKSRVKYAPKALTVAGNGGKSASSKDKMHTLWAFLTGPDAAELPVEAKETKTKKSALKKPAAAKVKTSELDQDKVDGKRDRNQFNHFQKYVEDLPSEVRELYESATSGI